jgi:outer membrane protein TolC
MIKLTETNERRIKMQLSSLSRFSSKSFVIIFCCILVAPAYSQTAPLKLDGVSLKKVTLSEFLSQVQESSKFLNTKKLSVQSSLALQEAMGAANINPSLNISHGAYYEQRASEYDSPRSMTYSLSFTVEAPGKRKARQDFASVEVSRAQLDSQVSEKAVQGDAAFVFIDVLRLKLIWQALQNEKERLKLITDKGTATALQNNELFQKTTLNDFKYFSMGMNVFMGNTITELFEPVGSIGVPPRNFKPEDYSETALARRNDIISLEAALSGAQASLNLTEKGRRIDLSPSVYYSTTPAYQQGTTYYQRAGTFGFSVTIPIPIANLYDGPLIAARNSVTQVELFLNDAKQRALIEVNQSLMQYTVAKAKLEEVREYRNKGLQDKSLTTSNVVQQRANEIDFIDAQTNHLKALIITLRATGDYGLPNLN